MAPNRVRVPVLTTTPRAVPLVTLLPRKQALPTSATDWSGATRASADFSIAMDSPDSADWLTKKSLTVSRRRSAGMMEPAARMTMSPGTISEILISASLPSLSARVRDCTRLPSDSTALPERRSST